VWTVVVFDHTGVVKGTCATCHDGVKATGKSTNHVPTTASCDACHGTAAWKPASFSHTGITSGCAACHNGTTATGKSSGHWVTARDCSYCHAYPTWTPLTFVTTKGGQGSHQSLTYPGDHTGKKPACTACHKQNSDTVTYTNSASNPGTCAGCHANQFSAGSHKKFGNTNYTASELKNCSGACHTYTDATLKTISKTRNGPQHRVTQNSFN
jgi:hypothetical protein